MFFAETQNKLLYAVTHNTAAELVYHRADSQKPNMGLTTWKGSIATREQGLVRAKDKSPCIGVACAADVAIFSYLSSQ